MPLPNCHGRTTVQLHPVSSPGGWDRFAALSLPRGPDEQPNQEPHLGAVKHSILGAIWHILSTGESYRDLGGDFFINRDPERQIRRLVTQLERLGHHVTLAEGAAAA